MVPSASSLITSLDRELFQCCTSDVMLCNSRTIDGGMLKVCMHAHR